MERVVDNRGLRILLIPAAALFAVVALVLLGAFEQKAKAQPAPTTTAYALSFNDELLEIADVNSPNDVTRIPITGLRGSETLIGIDFRPSAQPPATDQQGALYGVGTNGNIYTIDTDSGEATFQTRLFRADSTGAIVQPRERVALEGGSYGVDFNPTVDRLRIISKSGQNLRVNVDTGGTIIDGDLGFADDDDNAGTSPWATAAAYTNNLPSSFSGTTSLFDLEVGQDILVNQNPANDGTLITVGALGPDFKLNTGFDVNSFSTEGSITNTAYAAIQRKEFQASGLFEVNLDTGDAESMGRIGGPKTKVKGLAIPIGGGI